MIAPDEALEWFIAALVFGFAVAFIAGVKMAHVAFGAFQWAGF